MFTKKTRIVSLLVTVVMLISMVAGFSIVVTANTGSATPIDEASDFASIALDGNYILTADIDFKNVAHTPIGTIDAPFTGTFDGDGYTIQNLTLASDDNFQGLFGVNKGTIRNVKMDDSCSISGNAYVGAIAGKNLSGGVIENCISEATVSYTASSTVGGTYKVMTQNLCQWGDSEFAKYDTYLNSGSQLSRRPGMLARIKEVSPDLIAFQENSFTNMNKVSEDASWWDKLTGNNTNTVTAWKTVLENDSELKSTYTFFGSQGSLTATPQEGATVAYRTDKFDLLSSGTFWHSTNPDAPIEQQDANWDVEQANGELWGFGAGNKRVVNWVALEDNTTHQQIVLYSLHPQHDSETVRQKEIPVLLAKMDALRVTYPDAIFIAAGDYNASKGVKSYNMVDNYLNGEMDNARDIATSYVDESNKKNTSGNIYVGATGTIDHILIDGSAANVTSFEVRDELYDSLGTKYAASAITTNAESEYTGASDTLITRTTPLRPSDHNGVVATFEVRTNEAIGGVVGENAGSLRHIVAAGTADATAIGLNNGTALAVFGTGTKVGEGSTKGTGELTDEPSLEIVWKLNHAAEEDVFALVDGDYRIMREGDTYETPVRVRVNGIDYYTLPNSGAFNLDQLGIKDPVLIDDGKLIDDPVITVGTEDIDVAVADSIMNVTEMGTTGVNDFVIDNQDELEFADSKLSYINKANVTLYLGADIDLTESSFDGFDGKILFSLNGMGHTIKNWNTTAKGFFVGDTGTVNGYQGAYIKNITFDNVHTKGTYGRAVVVANAAGNNDFLMENVHVKNSSTTITNAQNSAAILYTHSNNPFDKKVTIRNCSIVDSQIKKADGITGRTNSGTISGRIGNGITYVVSDIYVKGFDNLVNDEGATGTKGNGILFGTKEGGVTLTLNNAAIFDSSATGFGYDLVGWQYDGSVKISNVITAGNTTNGLLSKSGGSFTYTNVYTDQENKETLTNGTANDGVPTEEKTEADGATDITLAQVKDGSIAYTINKALSKPAIYWEVDEDSATGALKPATAAEQTRKVTVKTDEGDTVSYADGGETLTISENAEDFFYVIDGNGSVNGGILTVSTDMDTVARQIAETDPAYRVVQELDYFEGKNLDYFENSGDIADAIDTLEQGLKDGLYTSDSLVDSALPVLTVYKNGEGYTYVTPDGADKVLPSVQEIAKYDDAPGYMINNVDDLLYVKSIETGFTADHTLYLGADLDLKGVNFVGFLQVAFNFDGLNHTISNWGVDANLDASKVNGLFRYSSTNSVKNLKFDGVDLKTSQLHVALIFGCHNSTNNTGSGTLTISNIHIKNSKLTNTGAGQVGYLLSNIQNARSGIVIENCSVVDSSVTGIGGNVGALVGRTYNDGATFSMKNCLVNRVQVTTTSASTTDKYCGILMGSWEAGCNGTIANVAVMNSSISIGTNHQNCGVVGSLAGGTNNLENIFTYNNTGATSLLNGSADSVSNCYYSEDLSAVNGFEKVTEEEIESGMVAAMLNTKVTDANGYTYWTTNEEGKVEPSDLANSTHKADLMANGKVVKSVYANGGESVELSIAEDPAATFTKQSGSGTLSGKTLTMPQDGSVTQIAINTTTNAFDHLSYPAVSTVNAALTAGGNYTIYNEADWDYLETNISYFQRQDITIHLAADIDLSKIAFAGFQEPAFSFDGHNHTVSGWGSTAAYATATAMFVFDGAAANGGTNFIKNLNIENCYVSGRAILVGGVNTNGGRAGLSTNFTVENVHIKNSGLKGDTNFNAFFIGGYGSTDGDYTVNMKNCSLIGSTMVGGGSGHAGMLIGKISGSGTSTKPTYNVTNIYMEGNTYTAGRANAHYEGMIIGNVEVNSTVNVKNLVAIGNTAVYKHTAATTSVAYIGNFDQGTATLDGIILLDNSISNTTDASAKKYLFTSNGAPKFTVGNVYCDDTSLVGDNEKLTTLNTKRGDISIASGEAAAATNEAASVDSIFYWRTEGSKVVLSDLANSTHKAELVLANGTVLKNYYANGGEKVVISLEEDPAATFHMEAGSSGAVSGRTLTMPTDGTVARVVVTPSDANIFAAYGYTSVSAVDTSAARTETNFTVANATEWMKVHSNLSYFNVDGVTIHLIADIDLGGITNFNGFNAATFNMDGHNHTVSNWSHSNTIGMFSNYVGGTIKNMTVENCHIGGGYGRALICGNDIKGNTVIENVDVKNCSVSENSDANLGGIFSGRVNGAYTLEVKNCSVIDTEIKTKVNGFTNSGIIAGRVAHGATYKVENLFVDGFQNNAFPDTTQSKGNGIIFGNTEGAATVTVKDVVVLNSGGTYASVFYEWAMNASPVISVENLIAVNNNSPAIISGIEGQMAANKLSFKNCYTDEPVKALTFASSGSNAVTATANAFSGIFDLAEADIKGGKAAGISTGFVGDAGFYLTTDNGMKAGTEANATRRVSYQVDGREIGKVYANGGSQITLGLAADPKATFALGANDAGTLDGNKLTLPTVGYMVVPIAVSTSDAALATVYGYPAVTTVTEDAHRTGLNYTIANAAEWMHFFGQYNHFQSTDVTIHIIGEVDLEGKVANDFYTASESALGSGIRYSSFMNAAFSMDGHGNTIKNWGSKGIPMATMGLFRYNGSVTAGLNFIKNLNIENWHTTGSGGSDTTFLVTLNGSDNTGRNYLSNNLVIENVHIKNSSMKAEDRRSGFFVANYVKADGDYSVTLKNCSLTDSTLNGAGGGHEGLLIGKASSFNGKKATYNLINIYVARNIHNAKRDAYVGLGIGNIEINGGSVAQMKVNMSNVVFEDNTLNSISATPALFGQFVGTEVNAEGVVFENNTVTSTVAMTGRTIFTAGATTQNVAGLYHDDANVTKAFGNSNNAGVKYGEEYMTSGEAAAAANVAGEDSVFFYTTTEDGVDLGTEANATRRVVYAVDNREVEFIDFANGGEEIEIGDYAYDPESTLKFEGAEVNNPFTVPTAGYMMVPIDVETTGNGTLTTVYGYPAATTVKAAQTSGNYTIANAEEWMYVYNNKAFFNNLGVTLHLIGTIDLSEDVANSFTGFKDLQSSFDGHDHTIKNFGTEEAPKTTLGIFYSVRVDYNYNGAGAGTSMNYLKNMKVDNCHVKAGTRGSAVFYGSYASNGGIQNGPENFLVENIHLTNCSMKAIATDDMALLVGRYNKDGGNASTLTIKGCSVIDSVLDLTGQTSGGHAGVLLGKGVQDKTNILDCYLRGVDVTGANGYAGIVMGSVESGTHTINNVAVVDCSITAAAGKEASLLCPYSGGTLYARYNLFQGNTMNADGGRYFTGAGGGNASGSGSINDTNLCDIPEVAAKYDATKKTGTAKGYDGRHLKLGITSANFESGEMVYLNNTYTAKKADYDIIDQREVFWTLDADKMIIPADGNQTRKVTFTVVDEEGNPSASQVYTYYTDYTKKLIPEFDSFLYKNYEWTNSASEKYTLDTTFTADAAYTAVGVVLDELEDALAYFSKKNLGEGTYFKDAAGIQALLDEIETRIAENEYQVSENAVPGLGFASLDKDIKLVKERYATYQDPNEEFTNVPKVSEIGIYADAFHYTIWNETDLLTAKSNEAKYPQDSTLNLMADLDLTGKTFAGFSSPKFNFDGHEHTIANWTHNGGSTDGIAFISRGTGHSIKNLTFDAATVTGGRHSGIIYGSHNGDTGMTGTLTIDNVHVKNSVLNVDDEQAAIFLPNTQSGRAGYVINNCSIIETTLNAPSGKGNLSGFVARLVGGAPVTITNCYIEGFDIPAGGGNVSLFCGRTESSGSAVTIHNAGAYDCNLNSTAEIYLCSARTSYNQVHNLQNIMLSKINAQSTAGRDKVFITYGNLDNIGFNTANNDDTTPVNIFMDQATRNCLHTTYPAYHYHTDGETPDMNIKAPTILADDAFTSGEAAWVANQVLIDAENDARWKVGEHGDYPVIDSLAASDWKVPYQVILNENRTKEGESYDFYTNKGGALNETAQNRMGDYTWTDGESNPYTKADTYSADKALTLESIVTIDVTWGEMEFVYNFGEWDEDNCVWVGNGWEVAEDTDNGITFANNGTVYREVALTYEKGGDSYGLAGQITKTDDLTGDLTAIPVDADGAIHSYEFMLNEIPAETWDDNPHTVGNLTISIV